MKRYKVELTIDLDHEWSGDEINDWDWPSLMDCGKGMELVDAVVDELVIKDYDKSNNSQVESNSGYNDGYTRKHYQDKLEEMKKYPHQDNHMD